MLRKLLVAVIGFVVCGGAVAAGSLENPQPSSNLTTKYTVGETCSTVSHIGAAR